MKVIANGGLNFSILDGWWDEGFDPEVGWKIGNGEEYTDHDYQDEVEARQLYHILETQIGPLFYSRGEDLLPRGWITKVKNSMKKLGPFFNTHRMVQEYFEKFYVQAYEKRRELQKDKWKKAIELADWKDKVIQKWSQIKINKVLNGKSNKSIYVGEEFPVEAEINLGELTSDDVEVQLYFGPVEKQDNPESNSTVVMSPSDSKMTNGVIIYKGDIVTGHSGQQGLGTIHRFLHHSGELLGKKSSVVLMHVMSQIGASYRVQDWELRAEASELIKKGTLEGQWLKEGMEAFERGGKVNVIPKVRHGLVVDEILAEVDQGEYDIVVLGSHRRRGWTDFLVDDIAKQVVARVDHPVLVVHGDPGV